MSDRKNKSKEEEPKSIGQTIRDYLLTIGIAIGIGVFLLNFVVVNADIPSGSMENTIMPNERIFGNRLAYYFKDPQRYDIVIFKFPDDENELFIKRIIGLPQETIIITGGKVYAVPADTNTDDIADEELIADPMKLPGTKALDDSFIKEPMSTDDPSKTDMVFRVPEDSYFMMGDNRNCSNDSRFWERKFVKREKIVGEAGLRYWPVTKFSLIGYDGEDR